ncbi:hypothetical protein DPMN_132292 [Dreissena polymorpha]|uniref:Uncharacterized protein n=1 Tax=Dreissena polymorpha TaxID=45954 RepID=A0A9D4JCZ5_DREPO|nr:hypothetical protein DPMN_132292 [Dreissena polymorpha]
MYTKDDKPTARHPLDKFYLTYRKQWGVEDGSESIGELPRKKSCQWAYNNRNQTTKCDRTNWEHFTLYGLGKIVFKNH